MKAQMLTLIFIFFINYLENSVGAPSPPQWDLINSGNNVQKFAQLIEDIYKQSQLAKLAFNLTFVKYASELAKFRVIDNNEEMRPTFKAYSGVLLGIQDEFVGFRHYSYNLDNFIANEFNKNIFCTKKAIPKKVVDQIMQLIFSFAARILLSVTYKTSIGIGEWQLQTLLSAYRTLAAQNDNNEDGIFPFPIVQIDANGDHLWAEFINQNISKQFIENFNFVLKLSEFSLSYYDVYKVLEAILIESNAAAPSTINNNNNNNKHLPPNDEPPPAVYAFLKQYFVAKLDHKSMGQSNVKKVDCAFVHFGRELERRLVEHTSRIDYPGFAGYVQRMEIECGKAPHIQWSTPTKNMPSPRSKQLEMELFHEPLWNYARAIQIDSHACKVVLQFADALIPKFGQILFETFNKSSDNVKYDETRQLLSFPSALSNHILRRLNVFVQRAKSASISNFGDKLDFVKTIQNIASMDKIEFKQRKRIPRPENSELFNFLFTLAIRLSLQIEQNDLAEKYLETFLFVVNQSFGEYTSSGVFALKIRNINKMVEVNLPTWKLPYFIYLENRKELEQENALKNFKFIHSLSEYSPTIYEIIKMANILGDINDGQIWISPSDSEIFLKVLEYLTGQEKPEEQIKVPIQKEFCILAYFVEDLLWKAAEKNNFLFDGSKEELFRSFILEKHQLCDDKPKEEEIRKHFRDMLQYANVIQVQIDPHKELQQIIPPIIEELEEMLQKGEWNYANLNAMIRVEWILLKFDLERLGQIADWEQIDKVGGKWRKMYKKWFPKKEDNKQIMKAQMLALALIFIFFINYLDNSVGAPSPPQWDLTNSGNNVPIFAQLIEDIYQQSLQFIDVYVPFKLELVKNDKVSFNFTFVKYASELANFRVIGNNEEMRPTFKAHAGVLDFRDEFVGFRRYSNKLDNFIANEFNKNILCREKAMPKKVVDQIMQLIFSFAARILLCLTYGNYYSYDGIGEWQLQTLLSAYKILAAENGIFPFPIIQIDANGEHLWAEFINQNTSKNTSEQKQYIENFNFVLKLSEFSLSYYEVYKMLEEILIESSAVPTSTINNIHFPTNPPPPVQAVHTFLKQYFIAKLGSKSMGQYIDCAFVHFGRELERRLEEHHRIYYPGFAGYVGRMEAECGKGPHLNQPYWSTKTKNTPSLMSKQLEMEMFHEPLWNYARAIQIDSHACKAVLQFADALSKIVVNFELNSDKKNEYSIDGITKLNEFKLLLRIIDGIGDTENYEKLENFENNSKKHSLNELSTLLKQIIKEYSCTNSSCPLHGHFSLSRNQEILSKFGQILFETFNNYSDNVKYDENQQLLSFPLALSEHILGRLNDFVQSLPTSITDIGDDLDFVKTIQNIASMDNFEFIQRKRIPKFSNRKLFKLLFILTIRLSLQMEQNDLAEKYLKTFLFAFNQSLGEYTSSGFFGFKIRNINKMVEVNLPTWKLPYFIYLENKKELEQENALKNFAFIYSLSKYSLSIFILEKQQLCDDKPKEEEIRKHFRDMLQYANVIEVQIDPHKELQQIIPPIIEELEEMLQKGERNYANLNAMKRVEWTLLEFDLERLEQTADWKQIDNLRDEWRKMYNEWFNNVDDENGEEKQKEKEGEGKQKGKDGAEKQKGKKGEEKQKRKE
uniref:Uncharacterized protein n=1 Tax=Globodera rostochiensis TaxID=31243 RepID=A0A914HLX5_GLORO